MVGDRAHPDSRFGADLRPCGGWVANLASHYALLDDYAHPAVLDCAYRESDGGAGKPPGPTATLGAFC